MSEKGKKFELTINVRQFDSPQSFRFSANCSGLDKLALWKIVEHLAQKNINQILNTKPEDN